MRLKQEVGRGTKITEDQVEAVKVKTDTMPQGVYVKTADVVGNVPLLYLLNKDWFHTLLFSAPGKIV